MSKKITVRAMALAAGGVLCLGTLPLAACNNGVNRDSIVIMAEEFSGLFNPFYATSGSDMDVVGQTQLSMLTTDSEGKLVAGENYATAVLDYEIGTDASGNNNVYTFVLKNGLKFSDGVPLTMNDVMFNIYEYLDPVYTGSSTMYSIKINGLLKYRTQSEWSSDTDMSNQQDQDSLQANSQAQTRINELVRVYRQEAFRVSGSGDSATYYATPDDMKIAIMTGGTVSNGKTVQKHTVSPTYKNIVPMEEGDTDYNKKLADDYDFVCDTFRKELNSDFSAARESFDVTTAPYQEHAAKLESDIFKFFLYEGYITPVYHKDQAHPNGDKTKIDKFEGEDIATRYSTQDEAVERVFGDKISGELDKVLSVWGTAGTVRTQYAAEAKDVILNNRREEGQLKYPRVDGIVSLGHKVDGKYVLGDETKVEVNNKEYTIAKEHNADGTPKVADTYDILRITLNGKDPKAKYNFSFSVSPAHYYSNIPVDIEKDVFGVSYADSSFQSKVIQSQRNVEVPLGAGPYKASNASNEDNPSGSEFWRNNYIYYKANDNFMFPVKTEKLQYQYVSSSNALDKLENREIDFVTPQYTKPNSDRLNEMVEDGDFGKLNAWQLGYGYVGINAGKVKNVNLRKAIMSAMQSELATQYYESGTCEVIDWPMSNRSWAYPTMNGAIGGESKPSGYDWVLWEDGKNPAGEQMTTKAEAKIEKYTQEARRTGATNADFKVKFTIAGASITEHPTYAVFKQAAELLNKHGWDVEVKADSQALTKLATGSLEVWAAAWGSTIDPDMYQVYHKNSTASSVYAWGYREILANQSNYSYEYNLIAGTPVDSNGNQIIGADGTAITKSLSQIIDEARAIEDESLRKPMYENAMRLVLNLAVEMPIYQRQNLYAYDAKRIGGITTDVNPFTSPLEKIWELEIIG